MAGYMTVWTYRVRPGLQDAFRRIYGPQGDWARLFRLAPGYIRTELYRDIGQSDRFLTIDYWESEQAWDSFRTRFAFEYERLDQEYAELTEGHQTQIGRFAPIEE
jgi:heme-degrading monooxygenase HmoA